MNGPRLALAFLTRVPVAAAAPAAGDWGRAARWFPLAGALVGGAAGVALLLGAAVWTPLVGAVLALAVGLAATGALHVDGVADCVDGMACNGDRERVLAVMHDPRVGAVGAAGVALLLLAKAALLAACVESGRALHAPYAAAVLARACVSFELAVARPATPGKGLFATLSAEVRAGDAARAAILAGVLLAPVLAAGPDAALRAALAAVGALLVARLWTRRWTRRIGGVNGDVVGAAVELTELIALAVFAA